MTTASHVVPSDALSGFLALAAQEEIELTELPPPSRPPSVSIVVPTYNHRAFILQLVEALSRLSNVSFEVVIVDDGSSDGSFDAVVGPARQHGLAGRILRLRRNRGRSTARNAGIVQARAAIIAFIDADCVPAPGWLEGGLPAFADPGIGIVQGRTLPHPEQAVSLFTHFIETKRCDGTFSTSNVLYRRQAILGVGGFDPSVTYWEDADLGWRVSRAGWKATFAPEALVYHQVLPLTPWQWVRWPLHFRYVPAKAARYPEFRRYLFLGLWVDWFHALYTLAVVALVLGLRIHRVFILLALPYLIAFPVRHGLHGRWPPVKAAAHFTWDTVSFGVLAASSLRHRSVVL